MTIGDLRALVGATISLPDDASVVVEDTGTGRVYSISDVEISYMSPIISLKIRRDADAKPASRRT